MESIKIRSALEVMVQPAAVKKLLMQEGADIDQCVSESNVIPSELADELLVAIAEATAAENETFAKAYRAIQEKNSIVTRDLSTIIE